MGRRIQHRSSSQHRTELQRDAGSPLQLEPGLGPDCSTKSCCHLPPSPGEQFGLSDSQISLFLTPHNASEWIWGVGPILQLPTATSDGLGTGRWSPGPTAALIYSNGPWFNGILAYQLMSFAGNRDRGSVNQTYLESEISYNFDSGWYVDVDPALTFDWTADAANGWSIPMGADVGKAFYLGSQSMSLQVGAYDFIERPDGTSQWIIRAQLTLLYPTSN